MARFASAEAIRWLKWGARSYQNFAMGLAVLLFAAAVVRTAWVPRPIAHLMALSGLTYLVQGWVACSTPTSLAAAKQGRTQGRGGDGVREVDCQFLHTRPTGLGRRQTGFRGELPGRAQRKNCARYL